MPRCSCFRLSFLLHLWPYSSSASVKGEPLDLQRLTLDRISRRASTILICPYPSCIPSLHKLSLLFPNGDTRNDRHPRTAALTLPYPYHEPTL